MAVLWFVMLDVINHKYQRYIWLWIIHKRTATCFCPFNILFLLSAGVGRTGTYIALDALFQMGKGKGIVNVAEFVAKMRQNRVSMVQTYVSLEFNQVKLYLRYFWGVLHFVVFFKFHLKLIVSYQIWFVNEIVC